MSFRGTLLLSLILLSVTACANRFSLTSTASNQVDGASPSPASSPTSSPTPSPVADFYVSPAGSDANPGTLASPFATLNRAKQAVQSFKTNVTRPIVVMLRGGTYYLPATVTFSAADSGTATAPISYVNYPGETPVISGGAPIVWNSTNTVWTANLTPCTTAPCAAGTFQNFEQLFSNGVRRARHRANNGGYLRVASPYCTNTTADCPNAFAAVQQTQADACFTQGFQYECFDRFYYKAGDLNPAAWSNLSANNANYPVGDIEVGIFEKWTMAKLRVSSVDSAKNLVTMTGPTFTNTLNNGFLLNHRYVVENVIDGASVAAALKAGEWFLDRSQTPWVLTYKPMANETPASASVVVPQLTSLLSANGLQYVTFKGVTLSHDNWTVPATGHSSTQAEPNVGAAISFVNSNYINFDSCVFAHTGAWTVEFVGTSNHDQVINSAMYDLGTGGLRIGQMPTKSDTDASVPQFNTVQNTVVGGFGRILPAGIGTGIWIGDSHDNLVTHNEVYDGYNGGIGVCVPTAANCKGTANSGGAFNNVITYNNVHDLGQGVTDDMGCIYVATLDAVGNKVLNNKCHDVNHAITDNDGYGGNGIYIDNATHGVDIENNLVYRVTNSAYVNNEGANFATDVTNTVKNNIFAFAINGIAQRTREPSSAQPALWVNFTNNLVYFDKGAVQKEPAAWYCYNGPCTSIFNFQQNVYWRIDGGLAADPNAFTLTDSSKKITQYLSFAQWQAIGEDAGTLIVNPGFANPAYPNDDYSLPNGSPGAGFVPFDLKAPGTTSALMTPPAVPATFPVNVTSPAAF